MSEEGMSNKTKAALAAGAALLLLALIGWVLPSEKRHTKEREEWRLEKVALEEKLTKTEREKSELVSSSRKGSSRKTRKVPVMVDGKPFLGPDGKAVYIEEESSDSFEEAVASVKRESESRVEEERKKVTALEAKLKTKDELVVKRSPPWALLAAWDPFASELSRYRVGGGVNFGPMTLGATLAPGSLLSLDFSGARPQVEALLRF